ncbi:hypothetical protein [Trabulsiella odontotermitis]|uniref:hypothetical protein n=1 Tax=Trabulsiella odontotermitis TaxID=379893 RepID=UPI000A570447|nr:hypothetical protein [Trabulsiella odontotermitis]
MQNLMPLVDTPDNLFHDGNPVTGELGTIVEAEHLNNEQSAIRDVQSEMISVLAEADIEVDPDKQDQLLTALKAILLSRANPFADIAADGAEAVATALACRWPDRRAVSRTTCWIAKRATSCWRRRKIATSTSW